MHDNIFKEVEIEKNVTLLVRYIMFNTKNIRTVLLKKMMEKSQEIIAIEKENINAINVFPIPDGDTGNNLFYTIKAIVDEVDNLAEDDDHDSIISAISKGAFVGAKGNSGVIYSQFLIGVVEALEGKTNTTPKDFSKALDEGTEMAYDAILNPTEGTILTIMKVITERSKELIIENPDISWVDFMTTLVEIGKSTLAKTKDMLKVLKDANVVDAGAKGLVHILESWLEIVSSQQ